MEIVSIEKRAFEKMMERFNVLVQRVEELSLHKNEKKMNKWLDNQDVCRLLNISPRTLQTLRDNGTLGYSQINHKMYYREDEVKRMLPVINERKSAYKKSSPRELTTMCT